PLLADIRLNSSQLAVERGELGSALDHAVQARDLEPWASSPYLQLALVDEQRGDLDRARSWIREAIDRDETNWQLWLVAARLETKSGAVRAGLSNLRQAAALNPRSRLFERLAEKPPQP
nr:tetratricopeptide repeat protein [Actinomycetota bacterium]